MRAWSGALGVFVVGLLLTACSGSSRTASSGEPTALMLPTSAPSAAGLAGSGTEAPVSGELTVFAASSLTDAFKEIGLAFEAANPGTRVTLNFGASTQLRVQLEQGARADLFASANQAELDRARGAGVVAGPDRVFAHNRLVLIMPRANPGVIADLKDLARPGLKLVTAAPEVPIGLYTQEVLDKMARDPTFGAGFKERVNANIVSREPNVRQVVAKVSLGEADGAVVYSSDVTPDLASNLGTLPIPDPFNVLATYPIAMVQQAPAPSAAEAFLSYLLGPNGQATLRRWGFAPPS